MLGVGVEERASSTHRQTWRSPQDPQQSSGRPSFSAGKLTIIIKRTGLLRRVAALQSFNSFATKQVVKRDYKTDPAVKSDWMSHSSRHLEMVGLLVNLGAVYTTRVQLT